MPLATKLALATLTVQPSLWECACSRLLKGGCRSCFEDAVVCAATWCSGLCVGSSSKGLAFAFSFDNLAKELGAHTFYALCLVCLEGGAEGLAGECGVKQSNSMCYKVVYFEWCVFSGLRLLDEM